jgi:hypothetical protein
MCWTVHENHTHICFGFGASMVVSTDKHLSRAYLLPMFSMGVSHFSDERVGVNKGGMYASQTRTLHKMTGTNIA